MTLDKMKSSVAKSFGILSIVPPVIATGIVIKTVGKSFDDVEKILKKKGYY